MRQALVLFFFFLTACKSHKDPRLLEKEEDIKSYYSAELKKSLPENGIIVILQNQQCVACRRDIFLQFSKLLKKSDLLKTFIMARPDSVLINLISEVPKGSIEFDTKHQLTAYGLDYGADLCLLMKNGQLEKWFEISNSNLENMHAIE